MTRRIPVVVLLLVASLAVNLQAQDWAQFRGPTGQGISQDKSIPVKWGDKQNLRWKLILPGAGFSSPIVVGKQVIVTCYTNGDNLSQLKRHLVSVNRASGKINWQKTIPSTAREFQPPGFAPRHGFASHTPVSDGKSIFVFCGNTGVVAFDMKGNEQWRKSVGTKSASTFGSGASLILYKDLLIVPAYSESEAVLGLDKKNGKQKWKAEGDMGRTFVTPVIAPNRKGEDELLLGVPFEVWSLNPANGKLKWYAETDIDTNACPAIVVHDFIAYTIGGRSGARAAIKLGGKKNANKNVVWRKNRGSYVSSPIIHKGHLYWFHESGVLNCVSLKTGEIVQRKRLSGSFYASATLINGKLYGVSRFNGAYVVEATPKLKQLSHNKLSDSSDFSASPAISDGQLFIRSDKALYCIQAKK